MEGTLEWGPNSHQIEGCVMSAVNQTIDSEANDPRGDVLEITDHVDLETEEIDLFGFDRFYCKKTSGPGMAIQVAQDL